MDPTTIELRTRDGIPLAADLYFPADEGRHPTLLFRTPYGKHGYRDEPIVAAALARGYAVVVQDVRGRYASAGDFDPYRREGSDGYDTIEALAALPWSNGRIATAGLSYPGAVQWLVAVEAPPHLVCCFPAMCFSSARQFFYFGGAFDMSWLPWSAINIAPDERRRTGVPGPQTVAEARVQWRERGRDALARVPLTNQPLLDGVCDFYFDWLAHSDAGGYWAFADIEARHDRVRVPIFNFSGWHDEGYGPIGAVRNFTGLMARGATAEARLTRLLVGPWTHGDPGPETVRVGDRDFGASAGLDYNALVLDWCDWHVRGIDRGFAAEPPVRLFVMGANAWRVERTWPVQAVPRVWHLRAGGALTPEAARDGERPDVYVYDPNDPLVDPHYEDGLGPHDQRGVEDRSDVLVYSTAPLEEDLEVVGPIEGRLWVASSALDTDFYLRVLDVEPDGTAWNLMSPTLEVLRAKYRNGEDAPEHLAPGRPVELVFRLGLTANRFLRGHRIRVHVTSSFFPHLDRNPNTGRPSAVESRLAPARQAVFHDARRPSRIVLPVVE